MTILRAPSNITAADGSPPVGGPDKTRTPLVEHREIITTECHDCLIEVDGWPGEPGVYVTLVSTHDVLWARSWRGRWSGVRRALQGRLSFGLELNTRQEVDELIEALGRARDRVYPT